MPRQRTGCSEAPVAVAALQGHARYDAVIYLFFFVGGRGKEKLWYRSLHHLSIANLNLFSQPCFLPGKTSRKYSMREIGWRYG